VQVYELAGHSVRSISTPDLSDAINSYGTLGDAKGDFYSEDEHNFFVLSFPAAGKTWMYDAFASDIVGTPVWSELSSNGGRHLIDLIFPLVNKAYAADYGAAKIYLLDKTAYTDNGMAIRREVDTRHFFKDYDRVTVDEIVADMETGVGLAVGQGVDPQVMMQISRDGGRTFGRGNLALARRGREIQDAHRAAPLRHRARLRLPARHDGPGEVRDDGPQRARERRAAAQIARV
jgi:hypothetical protein